MPRIVAMLMHTDLAVVVPALRLIGNIICGTDSQTQAAIDAGALKALVPLLSSRSRDIRREACWTVSNAAAGTVAQMTQLVAVPGMVAALVSLLRSGEWNVRKEAVWAVSNIATTGTAEHVRQLVAAGVVPPLVDVLNTDDARMLCLVLDTVSAMLKVDVMHARSGGGRLGFIELFEEAGLTNLLEEKQDHENEDVYKKCVALIEAHFSAEDGENSDPAPSATVASSAAFSFGGDAGGASSASVFGRAVGAENQAAGATTPKCTPLGGAMGGGCGGDGAGVAMMSGFGGAHQLVPTQLFASPVAGVPSPPPAATGFSFTGMTFV